MALVALAVAASEEVAPVEVGSSFGGTKDNRQNLKHKNIRGTYSLAIKQMKKIYN